MDWWNPTDWTAGTWGALAAWVTVGVAAAAARYGLHQVREARRTREEQAQPFVVVDLEPSPVSHFHMDLVIKNTGSTLARDVTFAFDPPLQSVFSSRPASDYPVTEAAILRDGILTMPPGKEFRLLFESMPERFKSDLPRSHEVTVNFSSTRGPMTPLVYRLDFDAYFNTERFRIYGMHDAAKALHEIERHLRN
jgi:hypothetical protein